MFKEFIGDTPLLSSGADPLFDKIKVEQAIDWSFAATLRALLYPRLNDNDSFSMSYCETSIGGDYIHTNAEQGTFDNYLTRGRFYASNVLNTERHRLIIFNYVGMPDTGGRWAAFIREKFMDVFPGYSYVDKINQFYHKTFTVHCFINPELETTAVFVFGADVCRMHLLQCSIPIMMPWFFSGEGRALTAKEIELIQTLRQKNGADAYNTWMDEYTKQFDFRAAFIRRELAGFEHIYERKRLIDVTGRIESIMRSIEDLNSRLRDCLTEKREYSIELAGLNDKLAQNSDDNALMRYFLRNERLVLHSVREGTFIFGVKDYLKIFDENMTRRFIECNGGIIERVHPRNANISAADMRTLLSAIFIEQTIKIRMCARYKFSLVGELAGLKDGYDCYEYKGYMPNPHIHYYACLGDYNASISERLQNGLYVGALEQCIASARSVNFADPAGERFIADMYNCNIACCELPDGTVTTTRGAIQYLKSLKEE